jgi:hypothetical protein
MYVPTVFILNWSTFKRLYVNSSKNKIHKGIINLICEIYFNSFFNSLKWFGIFRTHVYFLEWIFWKIFKDCHVFICFIWKKIEKEKVDQSLHCQLNLIHNRKLKFWPTLLTKWWCGLMAKVSDFQTSMRFWIWVQIIAYFGSYMMFTCVYV